MDYIKGLVSVVTPTYKRSEKLPRAIESVLAQTYKQIEMFVVNDNEPDDEFTQYVKDITAKYASDPRFHLVIQEKHINGAVARNVAIRQAKGEFIAFLDDDDWWEPNKIELQVAKMNELAEDWGGVSCRISRYNNDKLIAKLPKFPSGEVCMDVLMLRSDFATGTLLLRHTALDETGYFDEKLLRHQDLQLLIQFSHKYKLYQVDEFLHCCDVSDAQNRPNVEKVINAKKNLFQSVDGIVSSLSASQRRAIKAIHRAEVGYVMLKNRQFIKAIPYFLTLLTSYDALKTEVIKVKGGFERKKIN